MKGIKIHIDDVKSGSSFEMTRLIVRILCLSKGLNLSETELYVLTFFIVNGYNLVSREKLIEQKLVKNKQCVANHISQFRKLGIIVKNAYGEYLNEDFNIPSDCDVVKLEMLIKK